MNTAIKKTTTTIQLFFEDGVDADLQSECAGEWSLTLTLDQAELFASTLRVAIEDARGR